MCRHPGVRTAGRRSCRDERCQSHLADSRRRPGAAFARRAMCQTVPPDIASNFTAFDAFTEPNSSNATNTGNQTTFDHYAEQLAGLLNVYYTPLLVVLGSIGNLVSVFVFFSSKLRLQSTSQYLSALAISDTIFLLQLIPPWLNAIEITGVFNHQGLCQVFVYMSYVACCLSAWLVVAFTVERFVAVLYPLQRNVVCTVARARHTILSVATMALIVNLPVVRFATSSKNDCNIDYEYMEHAAIFNYIDTGVSFTIPLGVIVLMNTWITYGVFKLERDRQQMLKAERPQAPGRARPARHLGCPRSQQRVTRMLLIVSSVFVILNLPAYTMRILAYAYDMPSAENHGRWQAMQQVAIMFFNTNFGINFILYCLTGQNFRRALLQKMPWLRWRGRHRNAANRNNTFNPARASSVSTSFVSCTDGTANIAVSTTTPGPSCRRRGTFITRWTFDNSRQRQMPGGHPDMPRAVSVERHVNERIEMQIFRASDNI